MDGASLYRAMLLGMRIQALQSEHNIWLCPNIVQTVAGYTATLSVPTDSRWPELTEIETDTLPEMLDALISEVDKIRQRERQ